MGFVSPMFGGVTTTSSFGEAVLDDSESSKGRGWRLRTWRGQESLLGGASTPQMLQCYFLLAPRTAQITRRTIPVTTSTPSRSIGQPPDHTPFIMLPKLKPEPPPFPIIASNSFAQVLPRCMYPGIRCTRSVREAKRPRSHVGSIT